MEVEVEVEMEVEVEVEPEAGSPGKTCCGQGLTLVPISAQLELFCPLYKPTLLMNVSWSCSN